MPTPVTNLYAQGAQFKQLWGNSLDPAIRDRYMEAGTLAGDALIKAKSHDLGELRLKLAELQDWISGDVSQSARALMGSIIADVEGLMERPCAGNAVDEEPQPEPVLPRPTPRSSIDGAAAEREPQPNVASQASKMWHTTPTYNRRRTEPVLPCPEPRSSSVGAPVKAKPPVTRVASAVATMKVDRRTRAVNVDGVIYPSLVIATNSTGRSYSDVRAHTL